MKYLLEILVIFIATIIDPQEKFCTKYKSRVLLMCMRFQMTDNRIMQTIC